MSCMLYYRSSKGWLNIALNEDEPLCRPTKHLGIREGKNNNVKFMTELLSRIFSLYRLMQFIKPV